MCHPHFPFPILGMCSSEGQEHFCQLLIPSCLTCSTFIKLLNMDTKLSTMGEPEGSSDVEFDELPSQWEMRGFAAVGGICTVNGQGDMPLEKGVVSL